MRSWQLALLAGVMVGAPALAQAPVLSQIQSALGEGQRFEPAAVPGYRPLVTLEEGLAETVAWYRDNRDWWEPIKSGEYLAYYRRQYAARLS